MASIFARVRRHLRFGRPIIVVSGLPRSGTSMAMRMLEAGGLPVVTDRVRVADDSNPHGYYEHERVLDLDKGGDTTWLAVSLVDRRTRNWKWRQYVCESFCDSAAWYFAVGDRPHEELTLRPRFRAIRAAWFRNLLRAERQVHV